MDNFSQDQIPVGAAEDLTNKQFGELLVLYRVKNTGKTKGAKWRCQCSCSNHTIIDVLASNLKSGHTLSCGCLQKKIVSKSKLKDLTGQRFGRLTVLERGEDYISPNSKNKKVKWRCKCDCGNIIEVEATSLKSGATQSCGCLHNELNSKLFTENLLGQRFGKLVVISRNGSTTKGNAIWHCKCDCGNECDVTAKHLKWGDTKSCGCLISFGENKISQLLLQNNIPFETQKTFSSCKFPDTNRLAKFDFWVNNSYIIEFDGQQHFQINGTGYYTKEKLQKIKDHDIFKDQWCKENNIKIIRIPYWEIDNITIENLL